MKKIRTYQRYRCDHCKKTGTEWVMAKHEAICYYNPNRNCRTCEGTGRVDEHIIGSSIADSPCSDCITAGRALVKKFDWHITNHTCGEGDVNSPDYIGGAFNCPEAKAIWDSIPIDHRPALMA